MWPAVRRIAPKVNLLTVDADEEDNSEGLSGSGPPQSSELGLAMKNGEDGPASDSFDVASILSSGPSRCLKSGASEPVASCLCHEGGWDEKECNHHLLDQVQGA